MLAIDRVMRAYLTTRDLTEAQVAAVRHEMQKFIEELKQRSAPPDKSKPK
jgi:hypothetical protein